MGNSSQSQLAQIIIQILYLEYKKNIMHTNMIICIFRASLFVLGFKEVICENLYFSIVKFTVQINM